MYFDSLVSFVRAVQRERALSTYDQRWWWWCALLIGLFGLLLGFFSHRNNDQPEPEEQGTTVALVRQSPYPVSQDYYQCWFERRHCLSLLTQNQRFCQENINDWQHQNQLLKNKVEAFRRKYQQLERDYQALRQNQQQLSQTTRARLAQLNKRTP